MTDRRRTVLRAVGVSLLALLGVAFGIAAIIGVGYLSFLAIKGLFIVVGRAIVDGIKDSLSGRS